jgi:CDGSH iron-sulfur domain-containing protein 3
MTNTINTDLPSSPVITELEAGSKVAYCTCGWSAKGVFCDGSHSRKETGMAPQIIEIADTKKYAFCACRKTSNGPFCDGSHSK